MVDLYSYYARQRLVAVDLELRSFPLLYDLLECTYAWCYGLDWEG